MRKPKLQLRRAAESSFRTAVNELNRPGADSDGIVHSRDTHVRRVRQALTTAGAIDTGIADTIADDLEFALVVRAWPHPPLRWHLHNRMVGTFLTRRISGRMRPGIRHRGPLTGLSRQAVIGQRRAVPLAVVIPFGTDDLQGSIHVLSYAQRQDRAWLTVAVRWQPHAAQPGAPEEILTVLGTRTATDDRGVKHQILVNGCSSTAAGELTGELDVVPAPAADVRWLELDGSHRIDVGLAQAGGTPVSTTPQAPSEGYLHRLAAEMLVTTGRRRDPGDVVRALQAVGALPSGSPVPGQLVALTEYLRPQRDGVGRPPPRTLPSHWVLAPAGTVPAGDAAAGLALDLPEMDGVRVWLLGLSGYGGSILHVHAEGVYTTDAELPAIWLRDDAGWHVAEPMSGASSDGELVTQLTVTPPAITGSHVEILAISPSTQARGTIPVLWHRPHGA